MTQYQLQHPTPHYPFTDFLCLQSRRIAWKLLMVSVCRSKICTDLDLMHSGTSAHISLNFHSSNWCIHKSAYRWAMNTGNNAFMIYVGNWHINGKNDVLQLFIMSFNYWYSLNRFSWQKEICLGNVRRDMLVQRQRLYWHTMCIQQSLQV